MTFQLKLSNSNSLQYPFDLTLMACIIAERYHLDHLTDLVGINKPQLFDKMPNSFKQPVLPIIDVIVVALGKEKLTENQIHEIMLQYGKGIFSKKFDSYEILLKTCEEYVRWVAGFVKG